VANPVPNPVQRLRYFDGEYLRSYDFTDEQSYHIEMRRLMNRRLHLHGIVYGLEIVQDDDSVPSSGIYFYSIAPGMAIDELGQEIIVPAPYSLTNTLTGPGLGAGWYEVWICYQESETGLPAAGYLDCNVKNQNTRWQESFQVQLVPTQGPSAVTKCEGLRLGVVQVIPSPAGMGLAIQGPTTVPTYNVRRHYIGIRAQYLIAPDQIDIDQFDITAKSASYPLPDQPLPGYLDVHPGVFSRGNAIVKKNLVVGNDFVLNSSNSSAPGYSPNLPSFSPAPTGDVKITGDMFLQGNFYGFNPSASPSGQWYTLQQYIQSIMPLDVQIGAPFPINLPASVPFLGVSPNLYSPSSPLPVPSLQSSLASVSKATVLLAITSIGWQSSKILASDWGSDADPFTFSVTPVIASIGNPFNFSINWTVGPVSASGLLPITSLLVNYIVVFQP
jgi:hypothetical protein